MSQTMKVLTLNAWGVFTPFACEYRQERMEAIAKEVAKGEYDIVMLQEIWTQANYKLLCDVILPVMPHTHYFHSGMFGSGLCIFSKYAIDETMQYRYTLNGYAHKVYHGDWFCGKSVGLAKLRVGNTRVNAYITHLHAEYSPDDKDYLAHRITQSFQLSQFIRNTSELCDIVVVGGDFNLKPDDLGFSLVSANAALHDAWITQKTRDNLLQNGTTCDRPENSFTSPKSLALQPHGVRLDYLLYRSNSGYSIDCETCCLTLQEMPGQTYHYSDHEGVTATFTVKKNVTAAVSPIRDPLTVERLLTDVVPLLEQGQCKVKADKLFYAFLTGLSLVFLLFTVSLQLPFLLSPLLVAMRALGVIVMAVSAWMAVVMTNKELNGLTEARKDVEKMLQASL